VVGFVGATVVGFAGATVAGFAGATVAGFAGVVAGAVGFGFAAGGGGGGGAACARAIANAMTSAIATDTNLLIIQPRRRSPSSRTLATLPRRFSMYHLRSARPWVGARPFVGWARNRVRAATWRVILLCRFVPFPEPARDISIAPTGPKPSRCPGPARSGIVRAVTAETEYMGTGRAKVWTYLIVAGLLLVGAVVANFVFSNPELAQKGVDVFLGMPPWAFPAIMALVGLVVFWLGLKVETDWPEALGALLVAGAVATGEFLLGWKRFELGGLFVVPYVIPLAIFLAMLGYSVVRSK
jgi:hypothetical protein